MVVIFLLSLVFWITQSQSCKAGGSCSEAECKQTEVVIIGAGLSGLSQLDQFDKAGIKAEIIEQADDIGGTWHKNRYPGARVDVRGSDYHVLTENLPHWSGYQEEYPPQSEILHVLNQVDSILRFRERVNLNQKVFKTEWNSKTHQWTVFSRATNSGNFGIQTSYCYRANFVVLASGALSRPNTPTIPGLEEFSGKVYTPSEWPRIPVDLAGLKVGVVGTGSSGVQIITEIAEKVGHLDVFQRTPTYVFPLRNKAATKVYDWSERRQAAQGSLYGMILQGPLSSYNELGEDKFKEYLELFYQDVGGFDVIGIASDIAVNSEAETVLSEFIREKIKQIVKDPVVAEKLTPQYGYVCKRPVFGEGYFETFNLPHVTLHSIAENPISRFSESGLVMADGTEIELDVVVLATGFDAFVGQYMDMDIIGENKVNLRYKFGEIVKTYLGIQTTQFPNLFFITGPQSPIPFTNLVVPIQKQTAWIKDLILYMKKHDKTAVVPSEKAEKNWHAINEMFAGMVSFSSRSCQSYYLGSNVERRNRQFLPYAGSIPTYLEKLREVQSKDYDGFVFTQQKQKATYM